MEREDIEPEEYDESTLLTPDVRDMMELEVCFVVVLSLLIVYNFKEFFECRIFMLLSAIPWAAGGITFWRVRLSVFAHSPTGLPSTSS